MVLKLFIKVNTSCFLKHLIERLDVYDYAFSFIFDKVNKKCTLEYLSEGLIYYYKNPSLLKSKDLELY